MYNGYGGFVEEAPSGPSWFDTGAGAPLHHEMGTRDQANIVRLDTCEELVWVGTQRGRLLSYLVNLDGGHVPYSRFNVSLNEERVLDIITREEGIVSLNRNGVWFNMRGGVGQSIASPQAIARMTTQGGILSAIEQFRRSDFQLAIGTDVTKTLFYLNPISGEIISFFDLSHSVSKIHTCLDSPLMLVGGTHGQLTVVDGRVPRVVSSHLLAHPSEVCSISSLGTYVATCGKRFVGPSLSPDVFVKMFDMRSMRQSVPLSFPSGAIRAELNTCTSSMAGAAAGAINVTVLNSHGAWQQGELYPSGSGLRNVEIFQTDCYQPHSPDIDPMVVDWSFRNDLGALLDSAGVIHFWAHYMSNQTYPYRVNPVDSVPPSAILMAPRQPMMPTYPNVIFAGSSIDAMETRTRVYTDTVRDGTWASLWGSHTTREDDDFFSSKNAGIKPPVPVLPSVASALRPWLDSSVFVAPNTAGLGYQTLVAKARASVKQRPEVKSPYKPRTIGTITSEEDPLLEDEGIGSIMPTRRWKFTPVDYSINHSLFPFSLYNKCGRSGLENGQGALDCLNCVLQCLYNVTILKSALKAHVCEKDLCMCCELGFLFHMMDEARFARNKVCQPVRVSRVWKKLVNQLIASIDEVFTTMIELLRPDIPELIDKLFSRAIVLKTGLVEGDCVTQALEDHPGHTLVSIIYRVTSTGQPTPRGQSAGIGHHVAVVSLMDDFDTAGGRRSRSQSAIPGVTSGTSSPSIAEPEEEWILFNDFVVTMSSFEEAIGVCSWRRPMVAMYVNRELLGSALDIHHGKSPITGDMFRKDVNLSLKDMGKSTFTALAEEEIDQILKGDFTVALDTEFVSVGLGAVEIREDGSREIGKPGDMVVGRVSVIRVKEDSSDPMDAVPFIDHYVAMDEDEIKDYVTRFSGIRPGDLDVKKSLHWLVSSKAIYLKLRFLVDCGCKFVGHGLHTDFRIINLWIPAGSLIDTVQLFHLEGQRFLSLKFLANRLLNRAIQTEVHCSIEDARTALEIYRVYLARKVDGTLEQTIKSLYDYGRSSGWK